MTAHGPMRPIWLCGGCGVPWPCPTRRRQLAAEFEGAPMSLAIYMGTHLLTAMEDMKWAPAGPLHRRFLGWVQPPRRIARRSI
ncbi:hypothetical protein SAMN05444365_11132 [Micromonospora pattaloongensis]|uniref:Flavin reductase n=1 Tax=Micromonospora pattaloongensis TaxID=405436 RepID=A0A1H3SCW7_9ACTN|nr:hypothetical protein SAMN05444365_11132 [Micromonospora pattaloongensis]